MSVCAARPAVRSSPLLLRPGRRQSGGTGDAERQLDHHVRIVSLTRRRLILARSRCQHVRSRRLVVCHLARSDDTPEIAAVGGVLHLLGGEEQFTYLVHNSLLSAILLFSNPGVVS